MEVLNFRTNDYGEVSSLKRYACYEAELLKKDLVLRGRSPRDDIGVGTVFQEVPFLNINKREWIVKSITYRPHRNAPDIFFWEAKCKVI